MIVDERVFSGGSRDDAVAINFRGGMQKLPANLHSLHWHSTTDWEDRNAGGSGGHIKTGDNPVLAEIWHASVQ